MSLPFRYPDKPHETAPDVVAGLSEDEWLAQSKYDGWRMSVYIHGPDNVECLSRANNRMDQVAKAHFDARVIDQFKALKLPPDTAIDTEFVGPRGGHDPGVYILDMMAWNGKWLSPTPYEERWQRCCELSLPAGGLLYHADTVRSDFLGLFNRLKADWYATGCGMHLWEGIVLKRLQGTMTLDRSSSKKSGSLLKLKYREILDQRY